MELTKKFGYFCDTQHFKIITRIVTVRGVLKTKILKWLAIPFSSGPRFVRTLHHDHPSRVALHSIAHSFTELDKAVECDQFHWFSVILISLLSAL